MTRVVGVRFDPLTSFSVMRIGSFFFQFPFVRHDTKVDVVPVTSHDPLRHSMVILPQNVLTIHRVYVLTNLKQSTCTTLNKVYTMYSVYRQPNSQREWKYLTDVSTSTSVKLFSLEESRWDFVDPCIHWKIQLNLTLPEISYSIYSNDQVIINISITSVQSNLYRLKDQMF